MPASNDWISSLSPTQLGKLAETAPQLVPKGAQVSKDPSTVSAPTYTWEGTKLTPQQELNKATGYKIQDTSPQIGTATLVERTPTGQEGQYYQTYQVYEPQTGQTTKTESIVEPGRQQQQPTFSPDYVMNQAIPIFNELQRIWQETAGNVELAPLVAQAYAQLMSTIEQAEASIRRQFEEQMGGVDPATQAALASLKETVQEQRRSLMEEMSRRGLLQSGIWLEMEGRLAKGHLTAQQQMLGNRLSALQNQLNQALQNFASARINAASQYGLEGIRQLESDVTRRQEAIAKNLQNAINLAQWQDQQELGWYSARAPYELVPESERWQQEPTTPASQTLAPAVDYGKQLYEAQKAYSAATTQAERDAAALRGQEIRQQAEKAGLTTAQVDAAAQDWWRRGY